MTAHTSQSGVTAGNRVSENSTPLLRLPRAVLQELRAHGEETYPRECCGALVGKPGPEGWRIEALVRNLRSLSPPHPQAAEGVRREADYFATNAERMRYPAFRRRHRFVGSGVIEAGCKTVIGDRLKCSGMF